MYGATDLSAVSAKPSDVVTVTIDVINSGKLQGDEVVQVYAHAVNSPVPMPLQSLVGFQRVTIAPGETKKVAIPVRVDSLRRWDEKAGRYVVDPGQYELRVGSASDATHVTKALQVE